MKFTFKKTITLFFIVFIFITASLTIFAPTNSFNREQNSKAGSNVPSLITTIDFDTSEGKDTLPTWEFKLNSPLEYDIYPIIYNGNSNGMPNGGFGTVYSEENIWEEIYFYQYIEKSSTGTFVISENKTNKIWIENDNSTFYKKDYNQDLNFGIVYNDGNKYNLIDSSSQDGGSKIPRDYIFNPFDTSVMEFQTNGNGVSISFDYYSNPKSDKEDNISIFVNGELSQNVTPVDGQNTIIIQDLNFHQEYYLEIYFNNQLSYSYSGLIFIEDNNNPTIPEGLIINENLELVYSDYTNVNEPEKNEGVILASIEFSNSIVYNENDITFVLKKENEEGPDIIRKPGEKFKGENTISCLFNDLSSGNYYVGYEIDTGDKVFSGEIGTINVPLNDFNFDRPQLHLLDVYNTSNNGDISFDFDILSPSVVSSIVRVDTTVHYSSSQDSFKLESNNNIYTLNLTNIPQEEFYITWIIIYNNNEVSFGTTDTFSISYKAPTYIYLKENLDITLNDNFDSYVIGEIFIKGIDETINITNNIVKVKVENLNTHTSVSFKKELIDDPSGDKKFILDGNEIRQPSGHYELHVIADYTPLNEHDSLEKQTWISNSIYFTVPSIQFYDPTFKIDTSASAKKSLDSTQESQTFYLTLNTSNKSNNHNYGKLDALKGTINIHYSDDEVEPITFNFDAASLSNNENIFIDPTFSDTSFTLKTEIQNKEIDFFEVESLSIKINDTDQWINVTSKINYLENSSIPYEEVFNARNNGKLLWLWITLLVFGIIFLILIIISGFFFLRKK